MVLYDPTRAWVLRGLCRFVDPEPFFAPGGQPDRSPHPITQKAWDQAKLTCVRCPVLTECRRDTLGEEYGVYAGLDEHQRYRLRKKLAENERWKRWPEELRLEWGEHLAQLRARGLADYTIRTRTGLLPSVVNGLITEWREHRAKQPEPGRKARPEGERLAPVAFPENPGQKHGWVRDGRRIADGWYAGHTSDGVWVRMHIPAGKGAAYKFFKAGDVKFYRPQPHYVVPYFGRPDAADSKEEAHAA